MMLSIEQHVDWIGDCIAHMSREGIRVIEPSADAEEGWIEHANAAAAADPVKANQACSSWYVVLAAVLG